MLIDSGPLIALFDKDDKYHTKIKDFLKKTRYKLVTTNAVITQVSHMLDFNVNVQIDFFEWIVLNGILVQQITQDDFSRIITLSRTYRDRPMDFADATLVVIAEKLNLRQIISIDSDFEVYRVLQKEKIQNVFK